MQFLIAFSDISMFLELQTIEGLRDFVGIFMNYVFKLKIKIARPYLSFNWR